MPRGPFLQLIRAAFALVILTEALGPVLFPDIASDFTWLGLVVTALFVWGVMEFFRISAPVMAVALGATVFDGISALFEMYSRVETWDLWVHALGGAIIAIASLELILRALDKGHVAAQSRRSFIIGAVYLFTVTIGFLYEFWEYLVDKIQYGYPKSLVSAYDSIEDQIFNILGATLVLIVYHFWQVRKKRRRNN